MYGKSKKSKIIAGFFLTILCVETFYPSVAFGLTSGPAQPESKTFTPAGVTDMVDVFSGDFNYNLPLLDIDGYPVNLAYHSGSGIDDEASWVGLGWNLNVGSITRQLRGLPDDFKGEEVSTEHYTKPKITVGGRVSAKVETFGNPKGLTASGSLSLGIFSDNYTGIGAEIGANAGLSYNSAASGPLTASMGVGLLSNTATGVDVTPSVSLALNKQVSDNLTISPGITSTLGYNTRGGLKTLTLGTTFSMSDPNMGTQMLKYDLFGSIISFNTEPVIPKTQIPYKSRYGSFSFDAGGALVGIFPGGGGAGYRSVREVKSRVLTNPAFGYLYEETGKNNGDALMDFIREKDNPVIPQLPVMAIPVHTPDLFSYSSQTGTGQFRLHRGGTGILFDNSAIDESYTETIGFDAGLGLIAHGGVSIFEQKVNNKTKKWTGNNAYTVKGDFQELSKDNPKAEHVFFKKVGEKTASIMENETVNRAPESFLNDDPIAVDISGINATGYFRKESSTVEANNLNQVSKQSRRTMISYLTAAEASLDPAKANISTYQENTNELNDCHVLSLQSSPVSRISDSKKPHHISEITVTDDGGKKSVFGLPVYNLWQEEYTFAIGNDYITTNVADKNLVPVPGAGGGSPINHYKGTDHYFHKESVPAYPVSYLLTSELSPDYVDVTGDGVTDDDLGTAVKFNYHKTNNYKWRTPIDPNSATLNKGLLADPDDDKASIIVGEKELYYLHSIETKNTIAYFSYEVRHDALGVVDFKGALDKTKKQKLLREIRLFSKSETTDKPIKIVKFEYSYDLCQKLPNFNPDEALNFPNQGKLTLKKVYFLYGDSPKGMSHPYEFVYNNEEEDSPFTYGYLRTDRWGTYKLPSWNASHGFNLRNDEFPYSVQNYEQAKEWATSWNLKQIKLPTGGTIDVIYESDDYAFVQNRKAAVMTKIDGLLNSSNQPASNLKDVEYIRFNNLVFPSNITGNLIEINRYFRSFYLNNSDFIYTKMYVNLSDNPASSDDKYYEFVPCYAEIGELSMISGGYKLRLKKVEGVSPFVHAAWQRMRQEYPRYAYPGYKNRIKDNNFGQSLKAAVTAIVSAVKNLDELRRNFNERASDKNFASKVKLDKSFARLTVANGKKLGGGSRVKQITIEDGWDAMAGNDVSTSMVYGQVYEYTTTVDGREVSSGVATYEPSIGNDENPMRQPIPYVEDINGALNNFYNLEEPLGESFFPSPTVGYSKITVRDIGGLQSATPFDETGMIVHEFYTARDYPVQVHELKNKKRYNRGPVGWYSLFGASSVHELVYSQGLALKLNDMHGKMKALRVFNQSGSEISSTVYHYNSKDLDAGEKELKNTVTLVNKDGNVEQDRIIGREVEVFTDMREQETSNRGESINIGGDVIPFFWGPLGIPHWPVKVNDEYKLFRSAVTVKIAQYYGILDKVVKTENGSTFTTENVAYDGLTGEVVVSKVNNEFEKPVYSVTLPAYWIDEYKGMGGSYQNEGTILASFSSFEGSVPVELKDFLQEGDELQDLSQSGKKYWIIKSAIGSGAMEKRVVDKNGNAPASIYFRPFKVVRSGFRNMLAPATTNIVCLNNPMEYDPVSQTTKLALTKNTELGNLKVLSASNVLFDDNWGMKKCFTCPEGYTLSEDGEHCDMILVENDAACFNFCVGGAANTYGIEGALIKQFPGSTPVNVVSDFWGGDCAGCGTLLKTNDVYQYDSAYALHANDSVSYAKSENTNNLMVSSCPRNEDDPHPCIDTYCGRLYHAGVWLCDNIGSNNNYNPLNENVTFVACIDVPETKTYYLGYASDNNITIRIDGQIEASLLTTSYSNFRSWYIDPITLEKGKHILSVTGSNVTGPAAMAVEIYNNTYAELISPTFSIPPYFMIFSTARDVIGKKVQVLRTIGAKYSSPYFPGAIDVCEMTIPARRVINPYVSGFSGNWRPKEAMAYQVNRKYEDLFDAQRKGVDVKNAGYFESFKAFWHVDGAKWKKNNALSDNWVSAATKTLFDGSGAELESKDALGKYSASNYSFREQLPSAVASNSRHREIFTESFEDLIYRQGCGTPADSVCRPAFNMISFGDGTTKQAVSWENAHSGNYGLELKSGISLTTIVHTKESKSEEYLEANDKGELTLKPTPGLYPIGFQPLPLKKYLMSLWTTKKTGMSFTVNGQALTANTPSVQADGWSKIDVLIDLNVIPVTNDQLVIEIRGSGGTYVDDIRIHPFDALMKTYAYDAETLRMMAELDENNFATFYEYDAEGALVRVKKETERGIITIKESRSSLRKNNQ